MEERKRKREELLQATEQELEAIRQQVARRKKILRKEEIALKVGQVVNRFKMAKHFELTIEDGRFHAQRREEEIREEGLLDGVYVIRTSESKKNLSAPGSAGATGSRCWLGRCGVGDISRAREMAMAIGQSPALRFAGLMGYEGRFRASAPDRSARIARSFTLLAEAKAAIEAAGLEVSIVSAAGTSTLPEALRDSTITEIQAGTYALMEPDLEGLGLPFRCALFIIATVISRSGGRVVLDAGRRTVGCDNGLPIPLDPRAHTKSAGDEHVTLEWNGDLPPLGGQVGLRPTQNRKTFNLHSHVWLMRDERLIARYPIDARGGSQ